MGLTEPAAFYDRFGSTELGWGLMVQQRTLAGTRADRRVGTPDHLAEVAVLRWDGTQWSLLQMPQVGRLALVDGDGVPEIYPVNFTTHEGAIYLRTARAESSQLVVMIDAPIAPASVRRKLIRPAAEV